jgi:hypothetical protein
VAAGAWAGFLSGLNDIVGIFGVVGTIALTAVILIFALSLGYMVLAFGERGVEMLLPFAREALHALRRELTKEDPAIRLELRFTSFFGTVFLFSLVVVLLHAMIPWIREDAEKIFIDAFVASGVITGVLCCVSVGISMHLK